MVKNLPANAGAEGHTSSIPGSGRSPGGGHGNPPVLLPGKSYAWRSLVGLQSMGLQRVGHDRSDFTHPRTQGSREMGWDRGGVTLVLSAGGGQPRVH